MASFEDEAEPLPVTYYYFEDENSEPVSFHVLPIEWGKDKAHERQRKREIYLRGTADNGLEKVHMPVFAWKVDLFSVRPVISVLSQNNKWIVLQRPRKSFERIIKSILVTLHSLSYVIRNPQSSAKSMWEYLADVFRSYEAKPSQSDLVEHMPLINEAVQKEDALAKSKFIVNFSLQEPTKRNLSDEDIQLRRKPRSSTDDLFENVCAFCDNGGDLLCCEGRCLRSFHATVKDGEDYTCESLGFTRDQEDAYRKIDFYCKNCQHKQHQCYACGKLGSSDKYFGAEVFLCTFPRCGQFYHPHCVAKYETGVSDEELEKRIMLGESFTCPIHKCCSCKQLEAADIKDPGLQFAVCRRCPTSYHRKCLPRDIHFAKDKDDEDTEIRAWEGLLSNQVLIYCTKHKMVKTLRTPRRDHVKFPDVNDKEIAAEKKTYYQEKKRRLTSESHVVSENSVSRKDHVKFPNVNDKETAAEKKRSCQQKKRRLTSESHVVDENSVSRRKSFPQKGCIKKKMLLYR
ncbi:PREDICTED: protein ENHANCED DOWNY MILDEW 2-like [Fragaria vesca subsp. vesca]|uniref:protein ENHANCED DOWNY MILDEW 2-like n=1 Tax=Fragaria vesca subsp. vesca TaxID=101020 RepID=UPI0002C30BA5|nr:PREDICTED: protein ENHANCED DOWNY MILDEW 2-like [Fragaria vesca subsp. vesca]XP_011457348.1 PREDICTED: protein ENHANCED DOWNY MILDEW 2-like [Fragaria vesca subsp. vesca]XP_011457349.1 PREDICTED: protein ENHANCED DOWNY MILDEW 2-like [Fragaria vesca subsp. vesca]XP_011457350.1 PREDICTED: protein ENHANCED DOWNY MILDEW 2-like [Fragaria vesca subsp. vesca]